MRLIEVLKNEPHLFFLDSSMHEPSRGRYSFIGFDPFKVVESNGKNAVDEIAKEFKVFKELKGDSLQLNEITPLSCGVVGFVSYDYGLYQEKIKLSLTPQDLVPDCYFCFYDAIITIDHFTQQLHITSCGLPQKDEALCSKRAQSRLKDIETKISACLNDSEDSSSEDTVYGIGADKTDQKIFLKGDITKEQYEKAVEKALDHIEKGDIYQVNLSQRFMLDLEGIDVEKLELYRQLRKTSLSPFSAYFDCGDYQVMSTSPERFLQTDGNVLQSRPMKGTRPRSENEEADRELKKELEQSEKDKAELLMITDLLRNDIGKVCEYGSVHVKEMRTIEAYKTVYQATSTVEGKLKADIDSFDIIKACFPGGSITGCPKIRSMEIIEDLEPTRRGIYTGALGYISFSGNMDLNILIRTLLLKDNIVYFQVGGGIVADSTPEGEYEETLVKAKAIKDSLENVCRQHKEVVS
ncbi:MAG: aminodeoxychorismate synthase component I [Candidatus Omnitrophica bacterium]|nr:aminodeoxychorismate synthase component I [Candidatus Omnitrophota bacterium]MBU4334766.1 aminodeoxychorismate synthase component I [Candidatus Omnitrophota bacterium]